MRLRQFRRGAEQGVLPHGFSFLRGGEGGRDIALAPLRRRKPGQGEQTHLVGRPEPRLQRIEQYPEVAQRFFGAALPQVHRGEAGMRELQLHVVMLGMTVADGDGTLEIRPRLIRIVERQKDVPDVARHHRYR
jgi:hypothetical protein